MDDNLIRVRRASPADLDTLVANNRAMAAESEGKALDDLTLAAGTRGGLENAGHAVYFVALLARKIVGQTMATFEWSDWRNGVIWWIQSVYVDPSYRRRGVFKALYEHVRNRAQKDSAVRGLRLYVHASNAGAIETYRRLGMQKMDYLFFEDDLSEP